MLILLLACDPHTEVIDDGSDTSPADSGGVDTAPPPPPEWVGTGDDGPFHAAAPTDLDAFSPSWAVLALDGAAVTVDRTVTGLTVGDEVLLLDAQGAPGATEDVGHFLFTRVSLVSGDVVQLRDAPAGFSSAGQKLILQRVPNFTDVTITGALTPSAWDGGAGGVLAFRATGTVTVAAGGRLAADGVGYAGGLTGPQYGYDAYQGESYTGPGEGGAPPPSYNDVTDSWTANGGGGGANVTGGGGEYGGGATAADAWYPGGPYRAPEAGEVYGDAALTGLWFGSGGGGVWNDGSPPAAGGAGGGILYVAAKEIVAASASAFTAEGAGTDGWSQGTWSYGAGGGAGGTIWLRASRMELAAGAVEATGGEGKRDVDSWGGDGGVGRVRIDAAEVAGASLAEASEPDAYAGDLP